MMDESFIARLAVAHLIGDFILQPNSWVTDRSQKHFGSRYLYLHAGVQALLGWLFAFQFGYWWVGLLIGLGHLVFDGLKAFFKKKTLPWFLLDQSLHLLVILGCAQLAGNGFEFKAMLQNLMKTQFFYIASAYLLVTTLYSRLISLATAPWRKDIPIEREPLKAAGRWIGILERVLVLTFILIHQFAAIGFLLAAKSVFRFGDLRESKDKSQTEYVMIGTLLSFGITILTGLLLLLALGGGL